MVLALSLDLIEEFFLALFIRIVRLLLAHRDLRLSLQVCLEHLVVFARQRLNCNRDLLPEIVIAILAKRPHNHLFDRQHI